MHAVLSSLGRAHIEVNHSFQVRMPRLALHEFRSHHHLDCLLLGILHSQMALPNVQGVANSSQASSCRTEQAQSIRAQTQAPVHTLNTNDAREKFHKHIASDAFADPEHCSWMMSNLSRYKLPRL
jgi:hypothetical protein